MFSFINRTVFDIPLTWDRTRFEATRAKCRQARKLIQTSVNVQFEKKLRNVHLQNLDIVKKITETNEHLVQHEKKAHVLNNLTEVASQSLPNYFDKRMENVRTVIQEHCNAIQQIIREENEHWKEIHSAIDQNLITSKDIHPCTNNEQIVQKIQTIDEEEEENPSELMNNNTITSLLTQMIRKSRLPSKHLSTVASTPTPIESDLPSSTENLMTKKQERFSIILPRIQALHPIDTTYVVKLEDTTNTEMNDSSPIAIIPSEHSSHVPSREVEQSPIYSQPNLPARLYFSPTILQDEESEPIRSVLSPLDQNQNKQFNDSHLLKPKLIIPRFGQTFLLDNIKTEEANKTNHPCIRPKITDQIPFMIDSIPSQESRKSDDPHRNSFAIPKPVPKRRTRAAIKNESESIRVARNMKQSSDTNKRETRKRKQSISEDNDIKSNTIALRKRKPVSIVVIEEKKPKRQKKKKTNDDDIPIREPSPLPIIDRTRHYSRTFSTRSDRCNNFTLSMTNIESDDDNIELKTRSRLQNKSKTRNHDDNQTITSKPKKKPVKSKNDVKYTPMK